MKKRMLIALITVVILSAFGTSCFAFKAENVANTTKRGSFLIFPVIKAGGSGDTIDTLISISNDSSSSVTLSCVYKYTQPEQCECVDFSLNLTANQPISFSVKTGLGIDGRQVPKNGVIRKLNANSTAELKCWAVDSAGNPISFNSLSGEATINEGFDITWQYSAWRFAVGAGIASGKKVGSKGKLLLTGTATTYDACPGKLIFHFIPQTTTLTGAFDTFTNRPWWTTETFPYQTVNNTLTLVPCKQDCVTGESSDNNTVVRADLMVWNEYEIKSSGAWACVGCDNATNFYSEPLLSTKLHDPTVFSQDGGPPSNIIVVTPQTSHAADCNATLAAPLIGVMSMQFSSTLGPIAGETPTEVGKGQGWLLNENGGNSSIPVAFTYK